MATSSWSYRRQSNMSSAPGRKLEGGGGGGVLGSGDDLLQHQLEQARLQRHDFYRRLAKSSSAAQDNDLDHDPLETTEVTIRRKVDGGMNGTVEATSESISSSSDPASPFVPLPEPRSSWRYYTSYDNGEWRRHATPVYHADAESDLMQRLTERRSAASTPDSDVTGFRRTPRSRPPLVERHPRLRGCANLTRYSTTEPVTTGGSATEQASGVKVVAKETFKDTCYVPGDTVSDLIQKIIGDRSIVTRHEPVTERIIYGNAERRSICDDLPEGSPVLTAPEIPEGDDEASFVEKTLAPSGRPWSSSPVESQRIYFVDDMGDLDDEDAVRIRCSDGYDVDESRRNVSSAVEKWLETGCKDSPHDVMPISGRIDEQSGVPTRARVTSETTHREETHTVTETRSKKKKVPTATL